MNKRIYFIDFGDFVKIGVTGNIEQRIEQLPYKEKRFFCTQKIPNAFRLEKIIHNAFRDFRKEDIEGREYFNIKYDKIVSIFSEAQDDIIKMLEDPNQTDLRIEQAIFIAYVASTLSKEKQAMFLGFAYGIATIGG